MTNAPQGHEEYIVELYTEIISHLDFAASLEEEEHGVSATAERICRVLIPLTEAERERVILGQST
jgi:hypothetical protein